MALVFAASRESSNSSFDARSIVLGLVAGVAICVLVYFVSRLVARARSGAGTCDEAQQDYFASLIYGSVTPELRQYLAATASEPARSSASSLARRIAYITGRPERGDRGIDHAVRDLILGAALLEARVDELSKSQVTEARLVVVVLEVSGALATLAVAASAVVAFVRST